MNTPDATPSTLPGISGMSLYVPTPRVDLEAWCGWTGNPWPKVSKVVGRSFRIPAPHENVYTMAANAVLRLILNYGVDPTRVGFLGLGTESSTDNAAGAVIVRGMVDGALQDLGLPRLSRNLEVPEFKHACLGGIYALKSALRYVRSDGADRLAIVVSADIAEYERGSTGEQTQGAGAVAMLVERSRSCSPSTWPRAARPRPTADPTSASPSHATSTPPTPGKSSWERLPGFSGRYPPSPASTRPPRRSRPCGQGRDERRHLLRSAAALFFHRPYHHMPVTHVLPHGVALAWSTTEPSWRRCRRRCLGRRRHRRDPLDARPYAEVLNGHGTPTRDLKAASTLRRTDDFRSLLAEKMSLGGDLVREMQPLRRRPARLDRSGLEDAVTTDLTAEPMVMVGYGWATPRRRCRCAVPGRRRPAALRTR